MGFRVRKRINLGGGFGLNVSKSGVSPSLRTKYGTISSKSVSVRTGIKGVTYTKRISKNQGSGCIVVLFAIMFGVFIGCAKNKAITTSVYVCTSTEAYSYHLDPHCVGLKKCTHAIKQTSLQTARKQGRKPCRWEHLEGAKK